MSLVWQWPSGATVQEVTSPGRRGEWEQEKQRQSPWNTEVGAGGGGGGGRVVRVPGSLAWKLGPLDYYCYLSIKGKRQSLEG